MKEFMNNDTTNSDTKVNCKTHGEMDAHLQLLDVPGPAGGTTLLYNDSAADQTASLCLTLGDVFLPHTKGLVF